MGRPKQNRTENVRTLVIRDVDIESIDSIATYASMCGKTQAQVINDLVKESPKLQQVRQFRRKLLATKQDTEPRASCSSKQDKRKTSQQRGNGRRQRMQPRRQSTGSISLSSLAEEFAKPYLVPLSTPTSSGLSEDTSLVTVEEAARMMSIGRTSCYMLVLNGELKSVKIGRTRRVVLSSIDAYIQRLLEKEA